MRRYKIDDAFIAAQEVLITGESFHHIIDVCRQQLGHQFEVLNSKGQALKVELTQIEKRQARARIISSRSLPLPQKPFLNLVLALPKWSTLDLVVEKCVELGVKRLQIVTNDYSFLRDPKEVSTNRLQRISKVIQSATAQTARGDTMELAPVLTLEQCLKTLNLKDRAMGLFLYEGETSTSLKSVLRSRKPQELENVYFFIGSEGGYSEREVRLLSEYGLQPLKFGEQVLRVETACLALAAVLKYELLEE